MIIIIIIIIIIITKTDLQEGINFNCISIAFAKLHLSWIIKSLRSEGKIESRNNNFKSQLTNPQTYSVPHLFLDISSNICPFSIFFSRFNLLKPRIANVLFIQFRPKLGCPHEHSPAVMCQRFYSLKRLGDFSVWWYRFAEGDHRFFCFWECCGLMRNARSLKLKLARRKELTWCLKQSGLRKTPLCVEMGESHLSCLIHCHLFMGLFIFKSYR